MSTSCSRPKEGVTVRHGRQTRQGSSTGSARNERIAQGFRRWAAEIWRRDLPSDWQTVLGDFPEHLQSIGLSTSSIAKILPMGLRFIALLGKPPISVTKDDLAAAMLKQRSAAGCLSYLVLNMISRGHWPKSFLRQRAQVGAIEKYLAPGWGNLLSQLERDLGDLNVPYHAQHYFRRCATIFVWWSDLPDSGVLDDGRLRAEWEKFWQDRPDAAGGIFPKLAWSPERCYAAIWNCLLKAGRVQGTPMKFVLAAPPFWKTIVEPVRGAAHRLLGSGERPDDSEIRRRLLLYALTRLGFCVHGVKRAIEVSPEEWECLDATLRRESFSGGRLQALKDARDVLALINRGTENEERISR